MIPVQLLNVDSEVQPDNSFPRAHAIYIVLSHEPSPDWQRTFSHLCHLKAATRQRTITIVGSRLRLVVSPTDHLETVLGQIQAVVNETNARLATASSGE